MILPIYAYGHPVLKKETDDLAKDYPDLEELIANMWETMDNANGVGLAAPQIGLPIRLFVVDTTEIYKEDETTTEAGIRRVFINAEKLREGGNSWTYEEGCLSIPDITGDVDRLEQVELRYLDENFESHTEIFTGMNARVIQHEYDHVDGVLFTEYMKPLKKRLIRRKLDDIKKGKIAPKYKMKFPATKKRRR